MKKYKAIIYDLDGTMIDSFKMNIMPLVRIVEEETGQKTSYEELVKYTAWQGKEILADLKIKDIETVYARWIRYMNETDEEAPLYNGFDKVLEKFNDKMIQAVVSSKTTAQYQIDIVQKGIDKYFQATILAEDTDKHKPDSEPLLKCLEKIKIKPEEAIYIGDSLYDFQAANNAKVDFGYAAWGSVSSDGINNPAYIFTSPLELLKLIV